LLDIAEIESVAPRVSAEPVLLSLAAERALGLVACPQGTSVEVRITDDVYVAADPDRLEQILVNLLINAFNYGGSSVSVEGRAEGDSDTLTVSDEGSGVPAELIPHLFDPFTRAHETQSVGSGLGLSLCKRLAESFGASLSYSPRSDGGACFEVRLQRVDVLLKRPA
jgi:signal transduction histidine kinase